MKLGLLVAVLSPVIGTLYRYFSVTYMPVGLTYGEAIFQVIAHAIEGAVAGAMYKVEVAPKAQPARARLKEHIVPKAKQLTVTCENRPAGTLADIAKALGDAKVNILSCLATTSGTEGSVKLVVDNLNKAKKALDGAGLSYTEADVLQVELPNTPGTLGKFAGKLAEKAPLSERRVGAIT